MKKLISYIFPVFNEEGNIELLYSSIARLAANTAGYNYEFVFINDGSTDTSLQLLADVQRRDPRVVVINLSRNFGHQLAITAGLEHATGDAVIIMDSDLQDPPDVSLQLIDKWAEGYDVVYAQRRTRQDSAFKKVTATWFYKVLEKMADVRIPRDAGDFRLLDRKVVDSINLFHEHNRFLRGLVSYVGFKQAGILFDRGTRNAGKTKYPMKKMLRFAGDGIFGFSTFPLTLISRLGYTVSLLSFIGIVYAVAVKLFENNAAVPGWAFITIAVLLVGGVQLMMLGIVGSYIGRIYNETQNRPLYLVESILKKDKPDSEN